MFPKTLLKTFAFLLISCFVNVPVLTAATNTTNNTNFGFITRKADKLMDGDKEFRFIGLNTPNLHIEENSTCLVKGWHRTNEYEIRDIFQTILQMGGNVTRQYVFSIQGGVNNPNLQSHIYGPGKYDEELFTDLDLVLKLANEYKIRIIIPFIDNWDWWGGTKHFAAFRGKKQSEFCSDPEVIADFKNLISYVLNRTNTLTGIKYKDDPAILAWETGNELSLNNAGGNEAIFDKWTEEIAAYIKSIDSNHLFNDGKDWGRSGISDAQLNSPNIDIITDHYYSGDYAKRCKIARERSKGKKVFYVGEFNHADINVHEQVFEEVLSNGASGALVWSLRFHTQDGGYYYHMEKPDPSNPCYRWPGFESANFTNEAKKMEQIRYYAYKIQNMEVPTLPIPAQPSIISQSAPNQLRWKGSTGATFYIIERSEKADGDWQVIDQNASEAAIPYVPYDDKNAEVGKKYFYRIKAGNSSGFSEYSSIGGPFTK